MPSPKVRCKCGKLKCANAVQCVGCRLHSPEHLAMLDDARGGSYPIHGHAGGEWEVHGGSPTYRSWSAMKKRVLNPDADQYALYGGRGITICERWLVFENFFADMGERPDGMFLDRIDNDGNYEPPNCKWSTRSEQARNRRTNHLITHDNLTQPLVAWAEQVGISRLTLRSRLREGWEIERALFEPVRRRTVHA